MELTLEEAARRLGVSVRQAQRLARSGRLQVVRQIGTSILVDDSSVSAVDSGRRSAGRRWNQETAWAAIELLTYGETQRLASSQRSRLRARLKTLDVPEFVRLASGRVDRVLRMEQTLGKPQSLAARLVTSGRSALESPQLAEMLGLTPGAGGFIEGYVRADAIDDIIDWFGLEPSGEGNVWLSVSESEPAGGPVAVALDLCERGSTRECVAAADWLDRMLAR